MKLPLWLVAGVQNNKIWKLIYFSDSETSSPTKPSTKSSKSTRKSAKELQTILSDRYSISMNVWNLGSLYVGQHGLNSLNYGWKNHFHCVIDVHRDLIV